MKKLITTCTLVIIMITSTNAQINKTKSKLPARPAFPITDRNLNLEVIKTHLKTGDYCYDLNLASTAIIPPKTGGKRLVPLVGYFSTSNIVARSNQLVISGNLLKNTDTFRGGDNYTVFLGPDNRDSKKISTLGIFITWRLPGESLRTFQLKNVTIDYKPYGILIIGDYDYEGLLIAVSMTLTPKSCLL